MHPWTPTPRSHGKYQRRCCSRDLQMQLRCIDPVPSARYTGTRNSSHPPKHRVLKFEPDRPTGNRGKLCDTDPTAASSKSSGTIRRPKEGRRGHPGAYDDDIGAPLAGRKVEGHDGPRSRCWLVFCSARLRSTPRRLITTSGELGSDCLGQAQFLSGLPPVPEWRWLAACCSPALLPEPVHIFDI